MEKQYLFINGEIITVNERDQIAEAIAIKENKIIAAGSNDTILQLKDDDSEIIDLKGKTLIPGLIDSHLHISMYGTNSLSISCKSDSVQTIDDLLREIKAKVSKTPQGQWIRAWGYNEQTIADKRFPTKEELDAITTEHPIMITRTCGHISVVNSQALQIAEFDINTPDPDGGKFDRKADDELTGLLLENAHMKMFSIASFSE